MGRLLLLAGLAAVLVVGVGGVLLFDSARSDRIAEGVRVAGVPIGGRTVAEARQVVREAVRRPARREVAVRRGSRTFELTAQEAGVTVDVEATVQAALERSRRGDPWSRTLRALTGGEVAADVEPRIAFDEEAVGAFADRVGRDLDRAARDAALDPSGGELTVTEERPGFRTDREALRRRVATALGRPRSERSIDVPGTAVPPDTTVAQLAESNPVYLVVDRSEFRLRLYEELELAETYRIGVGQAGHRTPAGRYDISSKAVDPAWYVPDEPWAGDQRGEVVPAGDPDNPLAARWLGIEDGVGIHGTEVASSIGRRASHGCIRMTVPAVEELYAQVPIGAPVYIA